MRKKGAERGEVAELETLRRPLLLDVLDTGLLNIVTF